MEEINKELDSEESRAEVDGFVVAGRQGVMLAEKGTRKGAGALT
jgi:hypothetical protein